MARRPARRDLAAVLAGVRALAREPDERVAVEGLRAALEDPAELVVAKAAEIAGERLLLGLRAPLLAAWDRFYDVEDLNCAAKLACATALDHLEHGDPAPFVRGIRHVQLQAAYGKPEDVAAGLRARCAFAIARIGGTDALLPLAEALADPLPNVRAAAAQALAATGEPAAAALALFKLRAGDPDPAVVSDALGSLLALNPGEGLRVARERLDDPDVVLALGQSRLPEALPLLTERLADTVLARDREVVIVAVGLLRSDGARAVLLELVRAASRADATAAIRALATHSQAPAMRAAVEEAAEGRGLQANIEEAFG
ncbi:MAG: HEAT repeat domain-containing protein [Myxococcota bacterium]